MGNIKNERERWERHKGETNPTNPTGNRNVKHREFDIDDKTIKGQQEKQ
ncbi:hypothetical protein ACG2LH_14090 [Zhouia sp. PK063]